MKCHFCETETENIVEIDAPLGQGKKLKWKQIAVCWDKKCQEKWERMQRRVYV